MRQAIVTEFHGPTNKTAARIFAKADAGRLVVSWDHSKSIEDNHRRAAEMLCRKLQWDGVLAGGTLPGRGYAFVFLD
jgi:hypothetical protein